MKTPIEELIDFMKTKRYNTDGVTLCENKATELLQKEKKEIIDAYDNGKYISASKSYNGEKYFNETFKDK